MNTAYKRVRHLRQSRNINLSDFAQKLSISTSKLSKIETGKAKITVELAKEIAYALQVPVMSLLVDSSEPSTSRRSITRRGQGKVYSTNGMMFETLCTDLKNSNKLFFKTTISSRSIEENGGWRQHPGQEFIYVLSGVLVIHTQHYEPLSLHEGDSMFFDADQPHAYVAEEDEVTVLMMNSSHI